MKDEILVMKDKTVSYSSIDNNSYGTLTIFKLVDWTDIDGQHRMKKITLETHRNTSYTDATHYVDDMKQRNDNLYYRFDMNIVL